MARCVREVGRVPSRLPCVLFYSYRDLIHHVRESGAKPPCSRMTRRSLRLASARRRGGPRPFTWRAEKAEHPIGLLRRPHAGRLHH